METSTRNQQSIQSLDKGLQVLEMIEEAKIPLTLQDIWKKLKWNKATILRILNTLEARGYLNRSVQTKAYTLGIRVLALYNSLSENFNIQRMIRPYLEKIMAETGETAQIAILLNKKVVFIDRVRGRKIITANTEIGQALPLHCTGLGKAYLAYIDEEDLKRILHDPLQKFTEKTITTLNELKKDLEKIRKKGYAVDLGEYMSELRCVAAPLLNHLEKPIAMIGISGPKTELSIKNCDKYGKMIKKVANQVSNEIGYPS